MPQVKQWHVGIVESKLHFKELVIAENLIEITLDKKELTIMSASDIL